MVTNGFGNAANRLLPRPLGVGGQFLVGVLLGAVWSPCVGPTLGAASVLAAQRGDLASVAGVMITFGLGATLPLLLLSRVSREVLMRWRGQMMQVGTAGKALLGVASLAVSVLILSGLDRTFETALVPRLTGLAHGVDHAFLMARPMLFPAVESARKLL
jgi:cytochrome c biogenesis protein CcdA